MKSAQIKLEITLGGYRVGVQIERPFHLAIPLSFEPTEQPNAFYLARARQDAARAGDFIGDISLGGSANCRDIQLNPHGNGTHTESVAHIVDDPVFVGELASTPLIPAMVLSAPITPLAQTDETYTGQHHKADQTLTQRALHDAWHHVEGALRTAKNATPQELIKYFSCAIIIRTLPNQVDKKTRTYSGQNPPYPTTEALDWLLQMGCEHLVVDLPSIDREVDGNKLPNHHRFFGLSAGQTSLNPGESSARTVTELAYIPDALPDGPGFLNLQLPRFALDAAPSRPIFYRAEL